MRKSRSRTPSIFEFHCKREASPRDGSHSKGLRKADASARASLLKLDEDILRLARADGYADGKVDMRDVALVASQFGGTVPPANPDCDITGQTQGVPDGKIDMRDVSLVAKHFGEHNL
jgi:hypothetical protein